MSQTQRKSLEHYGEKCRELKRDLEHVLSDLEFRERGGSIRYAVDFSEIYAYALPDDTADEIQLFDDDDKSWTDSLHRLALRRLFDDPSEKLILLKPYAIELQRFRKYRAQWLFMYAIQQAPDMFKELEELRQRQELFVRIKELSEKAESGIALTDKESKEVIGFLENEAVTLLTFLDRLRASPLPRIEELFRKQRFDDLENLVQVDTSLDSEEALDWKSKLTVNRQLPEIRKLLKRAELDDLEKEFTEQLGVLLKEPRFEELGTKLTEIREQLEKQGLHNLVKEFTEQISRESAADRLDAAAIATVQQANGVLQDQKVKLRLVTRSRRMHMLFEHQSSQNSEPYADDSLLRHLRIFSVFGIEGIPTKDARQQLQKQLENIDAFLEAVEEREDSAVSENPGNESLLDERLERIKETWHSTEALRASLSEATLHEGDGSWKRNPEEIRGILRLLQNEQSLQPLIVDRLNELTDDMALEHAQLGWYIEGSYSKQQDYLINYLVAKDFGTKFVLKVSKIPLERQVPDSLEFYTDKAKQLLLDFFSANGDSELPARLGRSEVLSFFQEGLRMDAEYEPLLVMAYVLGTLKRWKLAEKYCERALKIAGKASNIPVHEGKFFLAICMRKESPSVERHRGAIELLDKAIDLKVRHEDGAKPEDPRYLKEKALHILLLNTDWIAPDNEKFPHPDEALKLLDRAYEGCENDPILRMRILIDRLYYFVETGQIDKHEARVNREYFELKELQDSIEPDYSEWPPFFIDTIAWTRWNLLDLLGADNASKKARIKVMEQLRQAVNLSRGKDRERCQRHLDAVKEGKRRQNWMTTRAKVPVTGGETLA